MSQGFQHYKYRPGDKLNVNCHFIFSVTKMSFGYIEKSAAVGFISLGN